MADRAITPACRPAFRAEDVLPAGYTPFCFPGLDQSEQFSAAWIRAEEIGAEDDDQDDVAPPRPVRRPPLRGVLLGFLALAAAVAGLAPAPRAAAVAVPTTPTVRVVLTGPTARVTVPVASTAAVTGSGVHVVGVTGPGVSLWAGLSAVEPEEGAGVAAGVVTGRVPAAGLKPGPQTWTLTDVGDGTTTGVRVVVLRQSRVAAVTAAAAGHGLVVVTAALQHRAPAGWAASQHSPLAVEAYRAGRWVPVGSTRTDTAGQALTVVRLPAGAHRIRVTRPEGATVTGAVSPARAVTVG